jgi:hypothetical protein
MCILYKEGWSQGGNARRTPEGSSPEAVVRPTGESNLPGRDPPNFTQLNIRTADYFIT